MQQWKTAKGVKEEKNLSKGRKHPHEALYG